MQTKLITLDISLQAPPSQLRTAIPGSDVLKSDALRSHIESELTAYGSPLRWAITHVNSANQTAHVEAVVTTLT
ncbi:MAG: hypothetical protein ACFB0D_01835 [Phormidesmis sp.]